jgi:hypothetical protein
MTSLKDKMAKGQITINDVRQAMNWATGEGGKFNGMLDKVAATPYGQLEGLRGELDQMMISIGEEFLPVASKLMSMLSWLGEKASPILKPFAVVLGVVSAALLVLAAAQWVANLAVWSFPGIWLIIAIVAVIAAITWLISKVSGWGEAWEHTVNGAKKLWETYVNYVKAQFTLMVEGIMIGIDKIKLGWYKFKEAVGLGDSSTNQAMIAELNDSVERRKQAITDSMLKIGETAAEAWSEFGKAKDSLRWNDNSVSVGITNPTGIPGANGSVFGADDEGKKQEEAKKTNTAIATGGTKHNYITINFKDLVGVLNIDGKSFRETTTQMEEQVLDALLRVTASATTAAQ